MSLTLQPRGLAHPKALLFTIVRPAGGGWFTPPTVASCLGSLRWLSLVEHRTGWGSPSGRTHRSAAAAGCQTGILILLLMNLFSLQDKIPAEQNRSDKVLKF